MPSVVLILGFTFILAVSSMMSVMPRFAAFRLAETAFPLTAAAFLFVFPRTIYLLARHLTPGTNRFGPNPNEAV